MLKVTARFALEDSEFSERFVRASGPGGQNVNKVATAVQLRFPIGPSRLPDDAKIRLRVLAGSRVTSDDELVVDARAHRTQAQNREDARLRLVALIAQALVRPRTRRPTRVPSREKQHRLVEKRRRAEAKRSRQGSDD